jgi:hypothetical protein
MDIPRVDTYAYRAETEAHSILSDRGHMNTKYEYDLTKVADLE